MKQQWISIIAVGLMTLSACQPPAPEAEKPTSEAPDYALFNKKVEIFRAFVKAHSDEDLNAQSEMMADTLKWSPPWYNGNEWLGKADYLAVLKDYQDNFENIQYVEGIPMGGTTEDGMWSGSVFPKDKASSKPMAIRIYGTWTATHTESGKEIGVKWFALGWVNDDGKISQFTEYFDVNGIAAQLVD
jgi:hypothetical protein